MLNANDFSEVNDLKRKADINAPVEKKKKKVMPKNAVMMLNEFRSGLEFKVLSCSGPVHDPYFVIGVDIDGQHYEGAGKSKKAAKIAAAENALRAYPEKYTQLLEEKSMMDSSALRMTDNTTTYLPLSANSAHTNDKHPCMTLNEIRPGLQFIVISEQGPPHDRQYVMSITIDGEVFNGAGRSKKEAKHNAAIAALSHINGF
ncbi:hypothetical protein KUTeg_007409 [Tegillarca granosa]|uniref:DRBM domain-containing protein n=1 Tax=Tegillarca granosa TaxID=220873 RepID=A0ABQ9FD80_TEGGR|nr:hypothetical protein KUTeg_007409 [Tegillarca granosa]